MINVCVDECAFNFLDAFLLFLVFYFGEPNRKLSVIQHSYFLRPGKEGIRSEYVKSFTNGA